MVNRPHLPPTPLTPKLMAEIEEAARWRPEGTPVPASAPSRRAKTLKRQSREFIAQIPYGATLLVSQFPGKTPLIVWLLIVHLARLSGASRVSLPFNRLTAWGVDRPNLWRALRHLEKAGLILIHKQGAGRSSVIELIELPEDAEEGE